MIFHVESLFRISRGLGFLLLAAVSVCAQEANEPSLHEPLYEKIPFQRIFLTAQYDGASHDVLPIDFAGGHRPDPLPKAGELLVRFVDRPLKEYTIHWIAIERIELFSELVEQEFLRRLESLDKELRSLTPDDDAWSGLASRFESLFDYLRYLERHRDELPNLAKTRLKFLFLEGLYRGESGDYLNCSARFEHLYGKDGENRDYPELESTWSQIVDRVMERESRSGDEAKCRLFLNRFRTFYPANPVVDAWEKRLRDSALKLCEQSKKAFEEKEFLVAHRNCEAAARITPDLPELHEWRKHLFAEVPRVDIAVSSPLRGMTDLSVSGLPDWNVRRGRRILCRMLCEYHKPSFEGGVYVSGLGTVERAEADRELRWAFSKEAQAARQFSLLDVADSIRQRGVTGAGRKIDSMTINSAEGLDVRFHRTCLVPEALFEFPIQSSDRFALPRENPNGGGLFAQKHNEDGLAGFELNLRAGSASPRSSLVLLEHTVPRGEEALELLLAGKIDMIDRIPPWEFDAFNGNRQLVTGRYAIPTVYFLVPNMSKPLPRSRTFRRALLYGLNRAGMLEKLIGEGGSRAGRGSVLSAPFIRGASLDDPLGYGYDVSIAPRPYEPKLAIALSLLAFDQIRNSEPGWDEMVKMPEIVLARPENETAEYVALMIRKQWEAINVPVRVVVYKEDGVYGENGNTDEAIGLGAEIDFWLVDRVVKEPLVDAVRIFGRAGMGRQPSPYMELALEKLHQAEDWPTAGKCLRDLHRLCFEETTVLPLWQIGEHYVHRAGIDGVAGDDGIFDLYQNVRRWTVLAK